MPRCADTETGRLQARSAFTISIDFTPLSPGANCTESKPAPGALVRNADRPGSVICVPAVTTSGYSVSNDVSFTLGTGRCVSSSVARSTFDESRMRDGIMKRMRTRLPGTPPTVRNDGSGSGGNASTCT